MLLLLNVDTNKALLAYERRHPGAVSPLTRDRSSKTLLSCSHHPLPIV